MNPKVCPWDQKHQHHLITCYKSKFFLVVSTYFLHSKKKKIFSQVCIDPVFMLIVRYFSAKQKIAENNTQ